MVSVNVFWEDQFQFVLEQNSRASVLDVLKTCSASLPKDFTIELENEHGKVTL